MRTIVVRPAIPLDPVFRSAQDAIEWRSRRDKPALSDSERIRDMKVISVRFSVDQVDIVVDGSGHSLSLIVRAGNNGVEWDLQSPFPFMQTPNEPTQEESDSLQLDWINFVHVWKRSDELSKLVGKTLAGLRASNENVWLYPREQSPLAFSTIVDCKSDQLLLFWHWDNS